MLWIDICKDNVEDMDILIGGTDYDHKGDRLRIFIPHTTSPKSVYILASLGLLLQGMVNRT